MEFRDYWDNRGLRLNDSLKSVMHHPQDNQQQIKDLSNFFYGIDLKINSILDYGCGVGRLSSFLNNTFGGYHGVDMSESMVRIAKEKNPSLHYTILSNYNDIPKCDMLFIFTVLLHIPPEEIHDFASAIKDKFKYIFIGEHMDAWSTRKFREGFDKGNRTWCFNRPLEYYESTLGFKSIKSVEYPTAYNESNIQYVLGEFI